MIKARVIGSASLQEQGVGMGGEGCDGEVRRRARRGNHYHNHRGANGGDGFYRFSGLAHRSILSLVP